MTDINRNNCSAVAHATVKNITCMDIPRNTERIKKVHATKKHNMYGVNRSQYPLERVSCTAKSINMYGVNRSNRSTVVHATAKSRTYCGQ